MNRLVVLLPVVLVCAVACDGCVGAGGRDGGRSSSSSSSSGTTSSSSGGADGGGRDGGSRDGGDGGTGCGPETPGFGEACGDCGAKVCGRTGVDLVCQDPGKNACNVWGQLDTAGGIVGRACGTCGKVGCADGGLVTECQGEHPKNDCGGCGTFPLMSNGVRKGPPDAGCSSCDAGRWACQVSLDDLSCWQGRATNSCGGCGRCIKYHADMSDLSEGAFVLAGTRALIEDVGADPPLATTPTDTLILTFEPLLAGPAGLVMEAAVVYLSPSERQDDSRAFALRELFSAYSYGEPGDPVRQFHVYPALSGQLTAMRYVIIYDGFLGKVISRGALVAGPP